MKSPEAQTGDQTQAGSKERTDFTWSVVVLLVLLRGLSVSPLSFFLSFFLFFFLSLSLAFFPSLFSLHRGAIEQHDWSCHRWWIELTANHLPRAAHRFFESLNRKALEIMGRSMSVPFNSQHKYTKYTKYTSIYPKPWLSA